VQGRDKGARFLYALWLALIPAITGTAVPVHLKLMGRLNTRWPRGARVAKDQVHLSLLVREIDGCVKGRRRGPP
jgi:hypothetical protein